jgi:hypothetical protein
MNYELVEFREPAPVAGEPFKGTIETVVDTFEDELHAVAAGRVLWQQARAEQTRDVIWWIVRVPGERLARWIADAASAEERVLDLTTRTLIPIHTTS